MSSAATTPAAERTCVYCGCTDSRGCMVREPGKEWMGKTCGWAVTHPATPTGVCTSCLGRLPGITLGTISIHHITQGKVWMAVASGPASGEGGQFPEPLLAAVVEKFYRENF